MTENAKIARLWQEFHHLSEKNKDLVLVVTEAILCPPVQSIQAKPEQSDFSLMQKVTNNSAESA